MWLLLHKTVEHTIVYAFLKSEHTSVTDIQVKKQN